MLRFDRKRSSEKQLSYKKKKNHTNKNLWNIRKNTEPEWLVPIFLFLYILVFPALALNIISHKDLLIIKGPQNGIYMMGWTY